MSTKWEYNKAKWQMDREQTFTARVTDERSKRGKSYQYSVNRGNK